MFAWMLNPPAVPTWTGPSQIHISEDENPARELAKARAKVGPPKPPRTDADYQRGYYKRRQEQRAAERGEYFLPLEPGQKRRRRVSADGTRVPRKVTGL